MKVHLCLTAIFLILLFPSVSALEITPQCNNYCHNSSHINKTCDWEHNLTLYTFRQGPFNCPYECNDALGICNQWPTGAIPGEYYILFLVFALILLGVGIFRIDIKDNEVRPLDLILPIIAFMLFSTLALQGNNVIDTTTGEPVQIIMAVWLCFGFSGISIIWFIFSLFRFLHREVTET